MINCDKGMVRIKGEFPEIVADWQTITTTLYKSSVKQGMSREECNQLLTHMLFTSVGVANRLLDEEDTE